jgi:hypothetical protein
MGSLLGVFLDYCGMDSVLEDQIWTPMEWDKKIPLGRQDLRDYFFGAWRTINFEFLVLNFNILPPRINEKRMGFTPDKQAPRLSGQAG